MTTYSATFALTPGSEVFVNDQRCTVQKLIGIGAVQVLEYATGQIRIVEVPDITAPPLQNETAPILDGLSEKEIAIAMQRFDAIKPLLDIPNRTRADIETQATSIRVGVSTLYKWIQRYEDTRLLTALAPQERSDKGSHRLSPTAESIIKTAIENEYLTAQKKKASQVIREVQRRCLEAGVQPPHPNTIRKRIKDLPSFTATARRYGRKKAEAKFSPIKGMFPNADWPLAVVQIDHTQLDIILVDDIHRHPIGRPWITLAIDVFSRMVFGFYVSFDPPGAASTGLCLAQAILPKEAWLAEREVKGEWPCWGLPKTIHMDNAKEFRGKMLQRACQQYGIDIEWRPVARPQFGGHVERLLGTISKEIHALPGATFSNPKERGQYDSEKQAAMTFSEFETWLTHYIIQIYHQKKHSALQMSPLNRFKQGVMGTAEIPGVGIPARIADENRLRLDFLPIVERTVQNYGIKIDNILYWHDVLRPWIGSISRQRGKVKQKFIFRRDPRDISTIWFFDPELQTYFPIPYKDSSNPPISIWELREATRKISAEGNSRIDESSIFEAYGRMRELEMTAKADTKATKRARQRRKMGVGSTKEKITTNMIKLNFIAMPEISDEDLLPFDEMDDMS